MIFTFVLTVILFLMGLIAVLCLSIGGTFFMVIASDLIVAIFVLYWIFFGRSKKNKRAK